MYQSHTPELDRLLELETAKVGVYHVKEESMIRKFFNWVGRCISAIYHMRGIR